MNIGFYHVERQTKESDDAYIWARGMVQSVRRTMPQARVVHLTDLTSRPVKGVDAVRRKPAEPMGLLRLRHGAGLAGDWLFVDTDVIFEHSVELVFRKAFDVAIPKRNWDHLKPAPGFTERMPFNTGVVFSRCPHFFAEAYARLHLLSEEQQHWMGEQQVINDMVMEERPRYHVRYISGTRYNFPPVVPDPDAKVKMAELLATVRITHYKGTARKAMLLERLRAEAVRCA